MVRWALYAFAIFLLWPVMGRADMVEHFRADWEETSVEQSPITFQVGGNPHFGMKSYRRRVSENKLAEAHVTVIQFSNYVMIVYVALAKGDLHQEYEPPSQWISAFSGLFKNGTKVDIRDHGSLPLSVYTEYAIFKYPFDKPQDCATYSGYSGGFTLGGVICAPVGKDLTKADLERYLGAIGYPSFLTAKPLAATPLADAATKP